jgi:hypothetical protein
MGECYGVRAVTKIEKSFLDNAQEAIQRPSNAASAQAT